MTIGSWAQESFKKFPLIVARTLFSVLVISVASVHWKWIKSPKEIILMPILIDIRVICDDVHSGDPQCGSVDDS